MDKIGFLRLAKNVELTNSYFSLGSSTTITDTKRFDAIKNASDDALNEVLSKIAIVSLKK
mgnify:CR=1 FL=1